MAEVDDFDSYGLDADTERTSPKADVKVETKPVREPKEEPQENAPKSEKKHHKNISRDDVDDFLHEANTRSNVDDEPEPIEEDESETDKEEDEKPKDKKIDEYGNVIKPVETEEVKERWYPESQVREMIRERLARGNHGAAPTNEQVAQVTQQVNDKMQNSDNANEADWQKELKGFVDNVIAEREKTTKAAQEARQREEYQRAYEERERNVQNAFETNFTNGMKRYPDFNNVVTSTKMNDALLVACRSMADPSAFVYAACKSNPKEIDRIAGLNDITAITLELGRLDEKMRKAQNTTKAARPLRQETGDIPFRMRSESNVDQLIDRDAKMKYSRYRR